MSHLVNWNLPLTRLNPFYPGQIGIPGAFNKDGLRNTCEGAIFYVDPNFPGVSDARDGDDPQAPLATVAAALTKCRAYRGDVIAVMANNMYQYSDASFGRRTPVLEQVTVDIPGVQIVGVCQAGALGVPWIVPANNGVAITIHAPDVLVEGFQFTGGLFTGTTAILAEWDGASSWGDAFVVRNCFFDASLVYGITLNYVYNAKIWRNEFRCETNGACIYTNPLWSDPALLDIWENRFWTDDAAISLQGLDDSNIYSNSFYNEAAATPAAATDLGIDLANGNHNMVFNNFFSCRLPVPAAGDWDDFCTAGANDAWSGNLLMNGIAVTNPT